MTQESVALYARTDATTFAGYTDAIASAEPTAFTARQLPTIDHDAAVAALRGIDLGAAFADDADSDDVGDDDDVGDLAASVGIG
jgi:hypothetical protein